MSLPAKNRLPADEIERVSGKGKMVQSENFGIRIIKRNDKENSRFAFVVSTKISKLAVHRNRINRALSESVRRLLTEIPTGFDFVFLAKKTIAGKTTEEIMEEVRRFFLKKSY